MCLRRIADAPSAAAGYEPELSLLMATCWLCADRPDQAKQVLVTLKQRCPAAKVRVGGEELPLFGEPQQALEWLDKTIGRRRRIAATAEDQWVMHRGNARRNARGTGSSPMRNYRWFVRSSMDEKDRQGVEQMQMRYILVTDFYLKTLNFLKSVKSTILNLLGHRQK